jgi:Cu/Ag efflux pump CusA
VRLADVAKVGIGPSPAVIKHDNISRSLDVTAEVSGDLGAVTSAVRDRVRSVRMPAESHLEVLDAAQASADEPWRIAGFALAALLAIYLLLQAAFGSWRMAGLVLLAIPLACAGGVLTALLVGGVTTLGALGGLLAVAGLALRNDVVLMRDLLDAAESGPPDVDGVMRVVRDRVPPVVLTAVATAAVLLPLLVLGRTAGTELLLPLAVVVLGGLVSSVVVTLLVLPGLYLLLARGRSRREADATPRDAEPEPARVPANV